MGLNDTPGSSRVHIGFFGRRNAGKSSVVNAVTGQELAVVSEVKGTTTDPVKKAMELLPLGPVVIVDTPGMDDEGALGELRVKKTRQILNQTDVAVLVIEAAQGMAEAEQELIGLFEEKEIPFVIALNKTDLLEKEETAKVQKDEKLQAYEEKCIFVSARTGFQIQELKEKIAGLAACGGPSKRLV